MSSTNRRNWIRQGGLALAGMAFASRSQASFHHVFEADPGLQDLIRIGSNENPYGPSPMAKEAMIKAVTQSNRYPWEVTTALREKIGKLYGLQKEHVLMGAGSSELLGVAAAFAAQKSGNAVAGYPTFRLWFTAAEHFGLKIKTVPLTGDKKHNLMEMRNAIDAETRMVYIVNPHNPTGTIISVAELAVFIKEITKSCLVLLDEAYTEYSDEPSLGSLVAENKNLIVAKTFSKIYGLAGARAGYVLAHPETITQLANYMPWSNAGTSAVSLAGAMASLDDNAFVKMTRQKTDAVREMVHYELLKMEIPVTKSSTSFVYYDTTILKQDLAKACDAVRIQGVRTFEAGTAWRRTSLGTMQEMEQFIKVVKQVRG